MAGTMTKVYVVIGGWDYEGYNEPDGVYSTRKKAELALKNAYKGYDKVEIMAYEIDLGEYERKVNGT